jgi:hypothetical protein
MSSSNVLVSANCLIVKLWMYCDNQ